MVSHIAWWGAKDPRALVFDHLVRMLDVMDRYVRLDVVEVPILLLMVRMAHSILPILPPLWIVVFKYVVFKFLFAR